MQVVDDVAQYKQGNSQDLQELSESSFHDPEGQISTQELELKNIEPTQLVQLVSDPEQLKHGDEHILQVLSLESPQYPIGQLLRQEIPLKNEFSSQDVQE